MDNFRPFQGVGHWPGGGPVDRWGQRLATIEVDDSPPVPAAPPAPEVPQAPQARPALWPTAAEQGLLPAEPRLPDPAFMDRLINDAQDGMPVSDIVALEAEFQNLAEKEYSDRMLAAIAKVGDLMEVATGWDIELPVHRYTYELKEKSRPSSASRTRSATTWSSFRANRWRALPSERSANKQNSPGSRWPTSGKT